MNNTGCKMLGGKIKFVLGFLFGITSMNLMKIHQELNASRRYFSENSREEPTNSPFPPTNKSLEVATTCSPVDAEESNFMHIIEIQQTERRTTLRRGCDRLRSCEKFKPIGRANSLFSKNYKFSVCDINKCASSSWLRAIMIMDGYYSTDDYFNHKIRGREVIEMSNVKSRLIALKNETKLKQTWKEYLNIITVRNPFERIVSAYYDKMRPQSEGFTSTYGPLSLRINQQFKKYRFVVNDRSLNDRTATFEDFVNFLLHSKEPQANDPHWRSFQETCDPCTHEYDFIMKFETMFEDVAYLTRKLNVSSEHAKTFFHRWRTRFNTNNTEEYFKKLPTHLVQALYVKYEADFDLFGYPRPTWLCKKPLELARRTHYRNV
ncbi:unnamed protein product [Clavelina lepadiformis]|uniref:Carbohydrate sulfotransferase n=1 Tax=Clavelina lepadiformis TaxID=159417 RepID=A0ABP0GSR4_CLALP